MSKPSIVRIQVNDPNTDDEYVLHIFGKQIRLWELFGLLDKEELALLEEALCLYKIPPKDTVTSLPETLEDPF